MTLVSQQRNHCE